MSLVGRQLGRYRLLEVLGSGGMSVVYRGLDTSLQREVAVKVLHPHLLLKQGDARRRLEREARAVARLHHPNIVEVFDVAEPAVDEAYLVSELVRGETLRTFAERERCWPPELGAVLVHQVAVALAHAHEAGVVHRDLKPENVMLREDGILKLMDFGIARLVDPAERMTQTGALVGSPAYMAPEVIDGQTAGREADVFALGTMLYWLWTGTLPFAAANTAGTLKRILEGVYEDPRVRTAGLSDALHAILVRCLQRKPEERYPSAVELELALAEALEAVELADPASELAAFHQDPALARERLLERLAVTLRAQATAALAAGRPAVALGRVDQLLGLRPEDPVAQSILARVQRGKRNARRRARLALGAGFALLALLVGAGIRLSESRATARAALSTTQPVLASASAAPPSAPALARAAQPVPDVAVSRAPEIHPAARPTARPETIAVELLVRPYGSVEVDGSPRSRDPLASHSLQLAPGRHTVRVSCQWCDDTIHTIDVVPGGAQTFALQARLKTAYLSFDFEPKDATVTVGVDQRTSEQSLARPFTLESPSAATRFNYQVAYVVSHPGYLDSQGTVDVLPGKRETLSGKLEPR